METSFSTQTVGYRVAMVGNELLNSQKYWQSLNLAVWPQTNRTKFFIFIFYLQRATACVKGRRTVKDGAKSATACIMPLRVACEIILADLRPWRGFTTEVKTLNSGNACMPGCEGSTFTWYNHCL